MSDATHKAYRLFMAKIAPRLSGGISIHEYPWPLSRILLFYRDIRRNEFPTQAYEWRSPDAFLFGSVEDMSIFDIAADLVESSGDGNRRKDAEEILKYSCSSAEELALRLEVEG